MENPIKMDDLGLPLFSETSIGPLTYHRTFCPREWCLNHPKGLSIVTFVKGSVGQCCVGSPFPQTTSTELLWEWEVHDVFIVSDYCALAIFGVHLNFIWKCFMTSASKTLRNALDLILTFWFRTYRSMSPDFFETGRLVEVFPSFPFLSLASTYSTHMWQSHIASWLETGCFKGYFALYN